MKKAPDDFDYRRCLGLVHGNLGLLAAQSDDMQASGDHYQNARAIQEQLIAAYPAHAAARRDLAMTLNNLSFLHRETSLESALDFNKLAVATLRQLANRPGLHSVDGDLALALNNQGALLVRQGQVDEALNVYREAIELTDQLVAEWPAVIKYRRDLGVCYNNLGRLLHRMGRHTEARDALARAHKEMQQIAVILPNDLLVRSSLGGILNNLGMAFEQLEQLDSALASYEEAVANLAFASQRAAPAAIQEAASKSYGNLIRLLVRLGRNAAAEQAKSDLHQLRAGSARNHPG